MASDAIPDEGSPERSDEKGHETNNGLPSPEAQQSSPAALLVQRVRALTEALEGSDISELELDEDGARILIRRQLDAPVVQARPRGTAPRDAGAPARRATGAAAESAAQALQQGIAVVAPLTGVFYGSPSPSAPAFVTVGDTVQAGQVVCLVEAMKVFNEIKTEISGTVALIVATSGQLVHRGEALIRIQPI